MSLRSRLATVLFLLVVARSSTAAAQTRSFELCFTSGTQSCSWFDVTSAAYLDAVTSNRIGTMIDIVVRHAEGDASGSAVLSALVGYSFHYAGLFTSPAGDADVLDDVGVPLWQPLEEGAAPATMLPAAWQVRAASSTLPAMSLTDSYFSLSAVGALEFTPGALLTDAIGGCGVAAAGGVIDAATSTDLWTCGAGNAYRFTVFTDAWFDVARVNAVGVQTYARFGGDDLGVAPFCTAYLDTPASFGDDGRMVDEFGFPLYGDVCRARDLATPPSTTVPEPRDVALLGSGLVLMGLGALNQQRRRRATI